MSALRSRLEEYLRRKDNQIAIQPLTPDASTREYYRISWRGRPAVACVYPEAFVASEQNYLDVSALFLRAGLPVAQVFDFDEDLGIIVVEDMGDVILRDSLSRLSGTERDRLINDAITLIARIQAATDEAYALNSIPSRLRFDSEKLNWELQFFKTHYFKTLRNSPLDSETDEKLDAEFLDLSSDLETRSIVLCHRDFHAANLMIDPRGNLRIIDHQDARIGPVSYDLVSLLLDRVTEVPPNSRISEKQEFFLAERMRLGLPKIERADFEEEFRLQAIQRCLKAAGTFAFQAGERGLTRYLQFIKPMFRIALAAIDDVQRFPVAKAVLKREI